MLQMSDVEFRVPPAPWASYSTRERPTRCRRGHRFEPWNLVASDLPDYSCLACCRARAAVTYARRKGHPVPDLAVLADRIFAELETQVARELTVEDIAKFRPGRVARVDWSRYDTGSPWELVAGTDFEGSPVNAAANARNWASRKGRKTNVRVMEDRIWLYFRPEGAPGIDEVPGGPTPPRRGTS